MMRYNPGQPGSGISRRTAPARSLSTAMAVNGLLLMGYCRGNDTGASRRLSVPWTILDKSPAFQGLSASHAVFSVDILGRGWTFDVLVRHAKTLVRRLYAPCDRDVSPLGA